MYRHDEPVTPSSNFASVDSSNGTSQASSIVTSQTENVIILQTQHSLADKPPSLGSDGSGSWHTIPFTPSDQLTVGDSQEILMI